MNISKVCAALLLCTLPGWSQMADSLKSEYHKPEELGLALINQEDSGKIPGALADPKTRLLVLQQVAGQVPPETCGKLVEWVRAGHTLWFYDAQLGPRFGFESYLMKPDQFTNKPEKGDLGGKHYEGLATTGIAMGNSLLNTGVGQVTCFLPRLGPDQLYGSVLVTGDTQPLLRFTNKSPAIAACRREGRGLIVFKPLLWPLPLSGDRFQSNLMEFSCGFGVPGPAGEGKLGTPPGPTAPYVEGHPAVPVDAPVAVASAAPEVPGAYPGASRPVEDPKWASATPSPNATPVASATPAAGATPAAALDTIDVAGEGTLSGKLTNEHLDFETGTSSLKLNRNEVERVELSNGGQLDTAYFRDGHKAKGLLLDKKLQFEVNGESRTVEKRLLRSLTWGKAG